MKQLLSRYISSAFLAVVASSSFLMACSDVQAEDKLHMRFPKEIPAVVGIETGIFFENIVRSEIPPSEIQFELDCSLGKIEGTRWTFTPTKENIGKHQLTFTAKDAKGKTVEKKSTTLIVVPAKVGEKKKIRVLIIGDSLTNATHYPNEIARLLSLPGNPSWEMLGTHQPRNAAKGVVHEGYGGWTWKRFITYYAEDESGKRSKGTSPFVYPAGEGKSELNIPKYFEEHCEGNRPDFITILLGINDCFRAPYDDEAAIDAKIEEMLTQADLFIAALRQAAPKAEIGICLTTPANSRDVAFDANYKGKYTRKGWKKIQHRLVQQQLKHFSEGKDTKLTIIPTGLYLDTTAGYPENNGVHPNKKGYEQIGSSIYTWLKQKLASQNAHVTQ